ncbi:hypothetical protein C0993_006682 [Termitomyces sp. T159_Od127]|nr:hypothetical protein C0993_006682 [Termitomyces sp. T159_Od127]
MPKVHRGGSTGLLRSHSRASSTSRLGANLQFTQKEQHQSKSVDKPKKTGIPHDVCQDKLTSTPQRVVLNTFSSFKNYQTYSKGLARGPSAQRVHSRDQQVQQVVTKQRTSNSTAKPQAKPGFTIASPGDEDDDEGEWESSESGAATPNNHHSDSESELDDEEAIRRVTGERQLVSQRLTKGARVEFVSLSRIETARQSDFRVVATNGPPSRPESSPQTTQQPQQQRHEGRAEVRTPTLPPIKTIPAAQVQQLMAQNHRPNVAEANTVTPPPETPSPDKASPRIPNRRHAGTRPPSSHSIRSESLRPHPLIRGHSYGQPGTPKPIPLEPLTVIQDIPTSAPSSQTIFQGGNLSSSPTSSLRPSLTSPRVSEQGLSSHRRQSVSSTRSVSTLPVHTGVRDLNWGLSDRKRTSSTISQTSSSAALSSLVHLPAVTRPPSPQAIAFFPPVNPHANLEGIHPLLPGPYLNNHLTILARRTPIKEAFDRVIRAKQARC